MVLTGHLPPAAAFKGLPGLRVIDIRMNALRGPLPDDWSTLGGQLEVVRLSQNFLNGKAVNFGVKSGVKPCVQGCAKVCQQQSSRACQACLLK
jgi:hypothetical protein